MREQCGIDLTLQAVNHCKAENNTVMTEKHSGNAFPQDIKSTEIFLTKNLYSKTITLTFFGVLESGVFKSWSVFWIIMGVLYWKTGNIWLETFGADIFILTLVILPNLTYYVAGRFKLRELIKFSEEVAEVKPGMDMER